MGSANAFIMVGKPDTMHNSIFPTHYLLLHENDRPVWVLRSILSELLSSGLITETDKGKFIINEEKIKSENDLIYFSKVKEVFENFDESLTSIGGGEIYGG